jgi:hypothetical protein
VVIKENQKSNLEKFHSYIIKEVHTLKIEFNKKTKYVQFKPHIDNKAAEKNFRI